LPACQQVHMQMWHTFACITTMVDHESEALVICFDAELVGDLAGGEQ
jgi:hypothetical protein